LNATSESGNNGGIPRDSGRRDRQSEMVGLHTFPLCAPKHCVTSGASVGR
jgi:hypothetical protein